VASFDHGAIDGWSEELRDADGDEVVCHNDMCVENVVFRGGRAVGLLDFDFAAPGRPVWDAAMAARMWAPMVDPRFRRAWPGGLDAVSRLGRFARAYGIGGGDAVRFVDAVFATKEAGRAFVRRHVDAGEPGFVEMWATYLGPERDAADTVWMDEHRDRLIEAVAG
jgi:aminoglycoside phosphotransferase (APT) family kinase protein